MEHQAQSQINGILNRVRSLDDLSINYVLELRSLSERCIVLDKFKISPAEYWNWLKKVGGDICGVEYDAQNARIVLKGGPSWMHEAATGVVYVFYDKIREKLSAATGSDYILIGSKRCRLRGKFSQSSKEANASVKKSGTKWPVVVLEVGISETTKNIEEDAKRWLKGSCG
ncbi:hypothetical protein ZTR_04308 [Talaromyces verruculosus]|nr:hypothetical protein ZTR_04308 [Talaromyces verruculosus]